MSGLTKNMKILCFDASDNKQEAVAIVKITRREQGLLVQLEGTVVFLPRPTEHSLTNFVS